MWLAITLLVITVGDHSGDEADAGMVMQVTKCWRTMRSQVL